MLGNLFKNLFKSRPQPQGAGGQAGEPGALSEAPEFVLRDPVLSRSQQIVGYHFHIRHPEGHRPWEASSQRFFDQILLDRLGQMDLTAVTGRRLAFCELQAESLTMPNLDALQPAGLVLSLRDGADPSADAAPLRQRALQLKSHGFQLALPFGPSPGLLPLMDAADFIHLPAGQISPADLLTLARTLRSRHPDTPLLAEGVDSAELQDACQRMHFDYFRGQYLTRRGENREPNLSSQRLVVTQVISHLRRKESDFDKLAMLARQDLGLTLRLLRYINSAALGLRSKVGSLEQAMTYIGRDGLYRWLTLLLFYDSTSSPMDGALRETALIRGRMCELLARQRLSKAQCEQAFVTGLLSMVDVLFNMPMEEALARLGLPDEIQLALREKKGPYGAFLSLALACEQGDASSILEQAGACGITPEAISQRYMEALGWALHYDVSLES